MRTLGVTGGIGSGKSAVCGFLEEEGARVFYADDEAKRLMQEDAATRRAVQDAFGVAAYDDAGRLNRAYLAQQVFGHAGKVERLNAIVHPRVFAAFEAAARQAEADGVPLLVLEAALLFESGGDAHVDATAAVVAPEAVRIARVVARDRVTPEQVRARMRHQLPQATLRARADHVLTNDGPLHALRTQAEALYRTVTTTA
jgi:dephospho-CoA kinase